MKTKTTVPKGNNPKRDWYLIDLKDKTLGRVCVDIAKILMGKDKTNFSYHADLGDYVVAINAAQIKVTGKKLTDKVYYSHSGFPGGIKALTLKEMMGKDPTKVILHGVLGMLPKNRLRMDRLSRLKVFAGDQHKYTDKIRK